MTTYYDILRIHTHASPEEIKAAYHKLALRYHPDKGGRELGVMQEINTAYEVLGDPTTRESYNIIHKIPKEISLKKVLVFGGSGAGKSSMLNALLGIDLATSDAATGCTFESIAVSPNPASCPPGGQQYLFFDTVGLNEVQTGTVNADEAAASLELLLRSIEGGLNLLIFVISAGRLTETIARNYEVFIQGITRNKVPTLCVVTGLEDTDPMQKWVDENKEYFTDRGLTFTYIKGACFAKGKTTAMERAYKGLREESSQETWVAIMKYAAPKPVKFFELSFAEEFVRIVLMLTRERLSGYGELWRNVKTLFGYGDNNDVGSTSVVRKN